MVFVFFHLEDKIVQCIIYLNRSATTNFTPTKRFFLASPESGQFILLSLVLSGLFYSSDFFRSAVLSSFPISNVADFFFRKRRGRTGPRSPCPNLFHQAEVAAIGKESKTQPVPDRGAAVDGLRKKSGRISKRHGRRLRQIRTFRFHASN